MTRFGRGLAVLIMAALLLTVPFVGVSGVQAATDQLDQSQSSVSTIPSGITVHATVRGSGSHVQAQTFTAGSSGELDKVSILISTANPPQHDAAVQIYAVDSATGLPTGSPLDQTTIAGSHTLAGLTWVDVALSTPVPVESGTQYALAVIDTGDSAGLATYFWALDTANPYSGGTEASSLDAGTTWDNVGVTSSDLAFKTYVIPDQLDQSQTDEGTTSGGDLAFAAVDGSGSSVDGQTFTARVTGDLDRVSVLFKSNLNPQHDAAVQIYAVDPATGQPTGSPLNQTTITGSHALTSLTWVDVALSAPVSIVSGTQYALALIDTGDSANGLAYYLWSIDESNPYSGGLAVTSTDSGATWPVGHSPGNDFAFKTYVVDTSPPTTTASLAGTSGNNGWYRSAVTVTLSATDPDVPANIASTYYAADDAACGNPTGSTTDCSLYNGASKPTISSDGTHTLSFFSVDQAGNVESQESKAVNVDATPPSISASVSPSNPAATGWYNTTTGAPTVSFTCSDATSGIAGSCPAAHALGEGTNQSYSASVFDQAGNSASAGVSGINVDLTAPTITYSGNTGPYTVDQQVNITCTATDQAGLSGIDPGSNTCTAITGPAYNFSIGTNAYVSQAEDYAGNLGHGGTGFVVQVTTTSLCNLTKQFENPNTAASAPCLILGRVALASGSTRATLIKQYETTIKGQSGHSLTADQAAILIRLAGSL